MRRTPNSFSNDFASIFVAAETGEARVTQSILGCPFEELDSNHDERFQPSAQSHFRGRHAFAPTPFTSVRQIGEWAALRLQLVEVMQQHAAEFRGDAGANAADGHEIKAVIVSVQRLTLRNAIRNVAPD